MEKIQKTRRFLSHQIAVATGAGLLAVVAGLGMAPAGAADDAKVRVEGTVDASTRMQMFVWTAQPSF